MKYVRLTFTGAQAKHVLESLDRDPINRNTLRRRGLIAILSREIKQQTEPPPPPEKTKPTKRGGERNA